MVRAVDRRYTFWLAGYYDDFLGARVVPDDNNTPGVSWYSSKTHQGNPINGWATLNPRYTYAWCERGDGVSAQFNAASVTTTERYKFNSGISSWLVFDTSNKRPEPPTWLGHIPDYRIRWHDLPQLEYPDSLTNANRQKFDGGTGILGGATKAYETTATDSNYAVVEGYMLMCNGYDTTKKYYVATGSNDSTFGRAEMYPPCYMTSSPFLSTGAAIPLTGGGLILPAPAKIVRTHMAGVYSGEVLNNNDIVASGAPKAALMPIESPSGKPFLVTEIYQNSTSSYDPIISYDGTLNSKGDNDTFIIRICPMAIDSSGGGTSPRLRLRIGCEGTAFTSVVGGDTGYSNAAIDWEIIPIAFQETTTYAGTDMDSLWDDYEIKINYTAYTYQVLKNGVSLTTTGMANKADGSRFQPSEMYGWELDARYCAKKVTVLIDRVGLIRYLNDDPYAGTSTTDPPAVSFSLTRGVNSISNMNLTLIDDDAELKLLSFFNQNAYADWSLLLFNKRVDRPIWRGNVNSLSLSQTTDYTPTVQITAADYFSNMDKQIPTWEVGQSGEGETTSQVAYNRSESQNNLNGYYFGTSILDTANATLGYNEVDDGAGVFKEHLDSRMRKRSAHPIQMYLGEDNIGPNDVTGNWAAAITAGHATSDAEFRVLQTKWMNDLKYSLWFRHMFSRIKKAPVFVGKSTTAHTVGGASIQINGAFNLSNIAPVYGGSLEVHHSDGFVDSAVFTGTTPIGAKTFSGSFTSNPATYIELVEAVTFGNILTQNFQGVVVEKKYYLDMYLPTTGAFNPVNDLYDTVIAITGATSTVSPDLQSKVNGTWRVGPALDIPAGWPTTSVDIHGNTLTLHRLYRVDGDLGILTAAVNEYYSTTNLSTVAGMTITLDSSGHVVYPLPTAPNNRKGMYGSIDYTDPTMPIVTHYQAVEALGGTFSIYYGLQLDLPATNFLQRDIPIDSTIKIRNNEVDDFKHIWVLWSDMRNDGEANADSENRRKTFGLMTPYANNYSLALSFANENVSASEEREQFTDLKIGEEVDLWEMDSTAEPITGEPWSEKSDYMATSTLNGAIVHYATTIILVDAGAFPTAGSGIIGSDWFTWTGKAGNNLTGCSGIKMAGHASGTTVRAKTIYSQWEDKAGSFVIIDTSKFFNLNTTSNKGKTGQSSGGKKEIGDFLVETEGYPILIDNYWAKAPASYVNLDDQASWHANWKYLNNDVTTLLTGVKLADPIIQLSDMSAIPKITQGVSMIISENKKAIIHYSYYGTLAIDTIGNTAVVAAPNGAGSVRLSGGNGLTSGHKASELYRAGHMITISGSTTVPSIDGDYMVTASTGFGVGTTFDIKIDGAITIVAGTCTIKSKSLKLNNLESLGVAVPESPAVGDWDGTAYPPPGGANPNCAETLTWVSTGTTFESKMAVPIDPEDTNAFSDALVYGTLSNIFPMRLLMSLNGFIESRGVTSWYDSDKVRITWLDSLTNNWLTQSTLYSIPDIGSMPNTRLLTNVTSDANFMGRAGRIQQVAAPSAPNTTITTQMPHGLAVGDVVQMVECYPLYSNMVADYEYKTFPVSEIVDPTNFKITNSTALQATVVPGSTLNGRWRKVGVVDDYGGINDCRNTTISTVVSSTQSLSGTGFGGGTTTFSWLMGRDCKPSYRPNYPMGLIIDRNMLKVSNLSTQSKKHITNVRVFYGGGASFVDYPIPTLGETPRWEIIYQASIQTKSEALDIAKNEYNKYKQSPLSIGAELVNWDNNNPLDKSGSVMTNGARYGYVADQSRTIPRTFHTGTSSYTEDKAYAWTSLWGGNLFPGTVSALSGRDGNALENTSTKQDYDENYWWYGANSIGYAVQVAHIPRNMPKTSMKTPAGANINADGKLRIAIEIGNGVDYDAGSPFPLGLQEYGVQPWVESTQFTIRLLDYDWAQSTYAPTERSNTTVTIDSNGYYEIDIPSTYWTGSTRDGSERIILSVNWDYLKSVAMRRCSTNSAGIVTQPIPDMTSSAAQEAYVGGILMPPNMRFAGANDDGTKDLFPLGMRSYGIADYWNLRTEWYAPRLHICDDINFVPATTVKYTDSTLELNAEDLGIKDIVWTVTGQQTEKLGLTLERDVGRNPRGFASLLNPPTNKGGVQTGTGSSDATPQGQGQYSGDGNSNGYQGGSTHGGFMGVGNYGSINPGTTQGSQLNPNTLVGTGRPGGLEINNTFMLNTNNLASNTNKKIKGTMDFNTDSITGGSFSVLGQKKPSTPPRNEYGIEGIDSFIAPSSGDATMGENGMIFGGSTDATKAFNEFTITARVPPNASSTKAKVVGRYSLGGTSGVGSFNVLVQCVETGASATNTITLARAQNAAITLFEGTLSGLNIPSNTIKVVISREAGTSPDTAQYSAVTLHNVQVITDRKSVGGTTESNQFSYSP